MKIHEIKLHENYVDAVKSGEKNFEVRNNDRGYQKGDRIKFTVVEGGLGLTSILQPLEDKLYEITYVHSGLGMEKNFVVLGIREAITSKGEEV